MSWADAASQIEDPTPFYGPVDALIPVILVLPIIGYYLSLWPLPCGYERGKIKWTMFNDMAGPQTLYWTGEGFRPEHPKEGDSE